MRWRRHFLDRMALAAAFLLLLAAKQLFGQENARRGSIRGTVTTLQENTASGLPGVTVSLTSASQGTPRTADTDETGKYEFDSLDPGNYTLSINQPGFKPYTKTVMVNPGQATVQDIRAELETVSEQVEVIEDT